MTLGIGNILIGAPTLQPQYDWYADPFFDAEYTFFHDLLQLPLGLTRTCYTIEHGSVIIEGDLLEMCLSKVCLLQEKSFIIIDDVKEDIFCFLCSVLTAPKTYEWRKFWVKASVLRTVLDTYPQYLQKVEENNE
tara:strand:+ start:197 stop:598 length:402 start_codon:yes stop_codon:yes gene_type:complete